MKVKDPVCGMTIEQKDAVGSVHHGGKTYYFCSESCKGRFQQKPGDYMEKT